MLDYVLTIDHNTFGLTEEEYKNKCIEAINVSKKKID
jgi:hypothetical protein